MTAIPKLLHFIWIGDESLRPDNCVQTWRDRNPGFEIRVWGNRELAETAWINRKHMDSILHKELSGVADMMRYEILHRHGGIAIDIDSICLRPLDDWLFVTSAFAAWENEHAVPGLIACGCMGAAPKSPFFRAVVEDIRLSPTIAQAKAWRTTGPVRLTNVWKKTRFPLTIYPSHYFYPTHHTGARYTGQGIIYAEQLWASTRSNYGTLGKSDLRAFARRKSNPLTRHLPGKCP